MIELSGYSSLLRDSFLVDSIFVNPSTSYSSFNSLVPQMVTTDIGDYADISNDAYQLSIMEGISVASDASSFYSTVDDFLVDYLNMNY